MTAVTGRSPAEAAVAVIVLLAASVAGIAATAQEVPAGAPADTAVAAGPGGALTALADSLRAAGIDTTGTLPAIPASATLGAPESLFHTCNNRPEAGVQAEVLKVRYYGSLGNTVSVRGGGRITDNYDYSYEDYRKQIKTVERRGLNANYTSGQQLPFLVGANFRWDWSKDVTVNTAGRSNLNARDMKNAGLDATKSDLRTWSLRHKVKAGASYLDQQSENQNQRNNIAEGKLNGALRSGIDLAQNVTLATRIYGVYESGDRALGTSTSPSSTSGDTLGVGVYYDREVLAGTIVASQSAFDQRYLDFRRNSIGQIDTLGLPDDVDRIVNELEERDALRVRWDNELTVGRLKLRSDLSHTGDQEAYQQSGVGQNERRSDTADFSLTFPVGVDSFQIRYAYEWSWDNQIFKGATAPRGRQYTKRQEAYLDWVRPVFAHTTILGKLSQTLSQSIAENQFNENDRDRVTSDASAKLQSSWPGKFTASMLFQYKAIDDINIRASKSANNNTKQTYELSPSYTWPLTRWLSLQQTYRLYIQFQDYDYGELESVRKDDNYNKRGTLLTILQVTPSDRLEVTVKYDTSAKFNATRTRTDATGNDFYRTDQEQWTTRADLGIVYRLVTWLTLEGATYRSRDQRDSFSGENVSTRETYSGEVWLGGTISKKWGRTNPLELSGRVKKYLAYGPNVTETNRDYWDADVSLKWSF